MKKRLLAMLLALCLCISLFPTTFAVVDYDPSADPTPEGYEGRLVLTRRAVKLGTKDGMLITVGLRNTGLLTGFGVRLQINTDKLEFARSNGNSATTKSNGMFFNPVAEEWLTDEGKLEFDESNWPTYDRLFEYNTTSVLDNDVGDFRLFMGGMPWNKEGNFFKQPEQTAQFHVAEVFADKGEDYVEEFVGVRLVCKAGYTWDDICAEDLWFAPDEDGGTMGTGVILYDKDVKKYQNIDKIFESTGYDAEGNVIGWFESRATGTFQTQVMGKSESGEAVPLSGATVKLLKEGDTEAKPSYTFTTDSEGKVIGTDNKGQEVRAGKYVSVIITAVGYDKLTYLPEGGAYNVEEGTEWNLPAQVLNETLYTYTMTATAVDGENGNKPFAGVTVTVLSNSGSQVGQPATTNAAGQAEFSDLPAGTYTVKFEKDGYATVEKMIAITDGNATVGATMKKAAEKKWDVTIPVVDGNDVALAGVTVEVRSGGKVIAKATSTVAGGEETTRAAGVSGVKFSLAAGTYDLSASKTGYKGATGTLTVNNDGTYDNSLTLKLVERSATDGIGTYEIEGNLNEDGTGFTVEVYLTGIDGAETGFFGLDYDEDILTLQEDGFVKTAAIQAYEVYDKTAGDFVLLEELNADEGYHFFGWIYGENGPLNTVKSRIKIAEYKFDVELSEDGDLSKCIDNESFKFLDFAQTATYQKYEGKNVLQDFWDDNGSDGEKHYQIRDSAGQKSASAMMFEYQGVQNSHVEFLVFEGEEDTNGNIVPDEDHPRVVVGATVAVYDSTGETVIGTTTSGEDGIARATLAPNADYQYRVEHTTASYWPAPGGYKAPDQKGNILRAAITETEDATRGKSAEVKVGMLPKVENDIKWDLSGEGKGKINGAETGTDKAVLHVDYGFVVEPNAGYQLKEGTTPTYTVTDAEGNVMSNKASKPMQDLPAVWDIAVNKWIVPGDDIIGTVTLSAEFATRTYTVTGTAGPNGNVTYDETTSNGHVQLVNGVVTHSGIQANENSTTFKFTPNNGYVIDRVAINGSMLPAEMTKGKSDYNYQFEHVQEDANIVVTYAKANPADPQNPTSEYGILTVNSGVSGEISVTAGDISYTVAAGTQTVRVLPLGTAVKAVVTADTGIAYDKVAGGKLDFVIDTLSVNNVLETSAHGEKTANVTIEITGDDSITATFIADDVLGPTTEPLQYHVVTKILSGDGTIIPIGDRLYGAGSSIVVDAYAATHWRIGSFEVNNVAQALEKTDDKNPTEYQYTIENLDQDYTIYVTYEADSVLVSGFVKTVGAQIMPAPTEEGARKYCGTGASLVFIKTENGKEYRYEVTSADPNDSPLSRFEIALPLGTYTVEVHKDGYLPQFFSNLEITEEDLGESNHAYTEKQAIELVAGNTDWVEDDAYIGDEDMRIMTSAMRTTASEQYKLQGDLDENGSADVEDMYHVKTNFAEEVAEEPTVWAEFLAQIEAP